MDGGEIIARALVQQGVEHLYTLCGGHISPILVASNRAGIRVIDVRDEASAVFAADADARMTGVPGVAAVTAGPGLTNSITAIKNAQLAESPVVVFGGATATVLEGRGALQDIHQRALLRPHVKHVFTPRALRQLVPTVESAFRLAREGVPGPVFIEVPVDMLYDESIVRKWYIEQGGVEHPKNLVAWATRGYLEQHLARQFWGAPGPLPALRTPTRAPVASRIELGRLLGMIREAERPVIVVGSQTLVHTAEVAAISEALGRVGAPVFLAGMARGLLGREHPLQYRHKRSAALKQADLVIVAGFPLDFRLGYGQAISRRAELVTINLDPLALVKNRRPTLGIAGAPGRVLCQVADEFQARPERWAEWHAKLQNAERERDLEIAAEASAVLPGGINPLSIFLELEQRLAEDSVLVVDGGDFVATASYVLRPRRPLSWLDPGVFGTLGVGGGFATAATVCRPGAEVWLVYGDGSSAYSLAEFDTWVRHGLAPIALVGNDGSWGQIARDQVDLLGDACGTRLRRTSYESVARGYGGEGLLLDDPRQIAATLAEAQALARAGRPVLINAIIGTSAFRKGSISI